MLSRLHDLLGSSVDEMLLADRVAKGLAEHDPDAIDDIDAAVHARTLLAVSRDGVGVDVLEIGLVHRLVDPDELLNQAQSTAARLAKRSPTAVRGIKTAIYQGGSTSLEKGLHIERTQFLTAASTPSAKRAMATYLADVQATIDAGGDISDFVADSLPAWVDGTKVDFTE
ncbi:enoyl-CoA hydratase/isomerase family protein [Nocardia fluminea]|uniref:enoyl-CoA hydratase/isomerase family protein n=1 Tax=Nocardia fluminea TaxID=134984 RepID=UPI003809B88B